MKLSSQILDSIKNVMCSPWGQNNNVIIFCCSILSPEEVGFIPSSIGIFWVISIPIRLVSFIGTVMLRL